MRREDIVLTFNFINKIKFVFYQPSIFGVRSHNFNTIDAKKGTCYGDEVSKCLFN